MLTKSPNKTTRSMHYRKRTYNILMKEKGKLEVYDLAP